MLTMERTTIGVVTVLERAIREASKNWPVDGTDRDMWDHAGKKFVCSGSYIKQIALRTIKCRPSDRMRERIAAALRMDEDQLFEKEEPKLACLYQEERVVHQPKPEPATEDEVGEIVVGAQRILDEYREITVDYHTLESLIKAQEDQALNMLVAASQDRNLVRKSLLLRGVGMIGEWMRDVASSTDEPMPVVGV